MDWLVFFLVSALLAFGPIVRGGNRQVALSGLLGFGLVLLALLFASLTFKQFVDRPAQPHRSDRNARRAWWQTALIVPVGASPFWLGLVYLVPVPSALWSSLPGRELYIAALSSTGVEAPPLLPLSLNPAASWAALLSGVPAAAVFFAAMALPPRFINKALGVLLAVGACQLLLALLQFSQGSQSLFYFGMPGAGGFVGSFANRNHLADFLAMLLPLWFYRLAQDQKPATTAMARHSAHSIHSTHGGTRSMRIPLPIWLFFGFALLVVILSTLSRGGIIATSVVLLASSLLLGLGLRKKLSRRQRWGLIALVLTFGLLALSAVGVEGIGRRIDSGALALDASARNTYTEATLHGAHAFWPWGSGAGTFESVFPRFQALESPDYVEYAHNDYAQILMELGLPGLLIAVALLVLILQQLSTLWMAYRAEERLSRELALRSYCGVAAAALLVHSAVEFNMHIPALAITAAFLMGVFLRPLAPNSARSARPTPAGRKTPAVH